jgi:hypothetical protein
MAKPSRGIVYTPSNTPSQLAPATAGQPETGTQGDIVCIQITATGSTDLILYDNASAAAGTEIIVSHTYTAGQVIPIQAHWAQGLWAVGATTAPGCVIWVED